MTNSVDVIVVGAGLSGLQAAVDVQKAGLSCLVLEADDRIGGKVLSHPNLPGSKTTVDLGAAWINDTSQSHIYALAKKIGLKFQKQFVGDTVTEFEDGSILKLAPGQLPVRPEDQEVLAQLVTKIDETGSSIKEENFCGPLSQELDKLTFRQWVGQQTNNNRQVSAFMEFCTDGFVGAPADTFSALYMLRYIEAATGFLNITGSEEGGGQYLRPYTGSISYVNALVSELKSGSVLTQTPVTSACQYKDHCVVSSSSGADYKAEKVIISVPTPLYKDIAFEPELPEPKQILSKSTKLGYYSKLVLVYSSPWWRQNNWSGQTTSLIGPVRFSFDTSVDDRDQYSLSLFLVGVLGREWSKLSESERKKTAMDHLHRLARDFVDEGKIPEPLNAIEFEWSKQKWFQGAPSPVYPPGVLTSTAGKALLEPVGNVHFVGTETADVWEGYMEGALRSGERGAAEVVAALKHCS